jgi:guanylate kinase
LENFTRKVLAGNMLEATEFNSWFYGTLTTALVPDKINIGIFSTSALKQLQNNENLNVLVIKVDAMDKTCLLRALNREECPDCEEICRRFLADTKDLAQIKEDTLISNEDDTDSDLLQNARVSLHIEDLWNEIHPETFFAEAIKADEVLKGNMD